MASGERYDISRQEPIDLPLLVEQVKAGDQGAIESYTQHFIFPIATRFLQKHPAEFNDTVLTTSMNKILYTEFHDREPYEKQVFENRLTIWCKTILVHDWMDAWRRQHREENDERYIDHRHTPKKNCLLRN